MALLLITHDMGVIAGHADRVQVMYAGRMVEVTGTRELFDGMRHPYTRALLASIPRLSQDNRQRLLTIGGLPPDLSRPSAGCRFAPRCDRAVGECQDQEPPLTEETAGHLFSCWHPVEGSANSATENGAVARPRVVARPAGPDGEASVQPVPPLMEVRDLVKKFPVTVGTIVRRKAAFVHAVSNVSFSVAAGETFGLVGESGCGKTTIGRLVAAVERPNAGSVLVNGRDLATLSGGALRRQRRDLQMVFQDPYSSLDPVMRVGSLIREPLSVQRVGTHRQQQQRVFELLDEVGLPRSAVERYPHEFSAGQRQRIGLARALTLSPKVIVADEPVSALDVSISAQVLNLMKRLQGDHGLTYIVISHDLAVVRYMADRIGVMYLGKLVEMGVGGGHLPPRGAPLHGQPHRDNPDSRSGRGSRSEWRRDQGRTAQPDQPAIRLPVPVPVPVRPGPVCRRGAAVAPVRPEPHRRLPFPAARPASFRLARDRCRNERR